MLQVKVYNESGLDLPKYETAGATGMDVMSKVDLILEPGETKVVPTGLFMEIPDGYEILVFPRSGMSLKTDLRIANSVGKIDHDYRGELGVIMWNKGDNAVNIWRGDKIAQITVYQPPKFEWSVVGSRDELSATDRGIHGFGSTGVTNAK